MTLPIRTIDELVARYQLEPSIVDIFVEGSFDLDAINILLGKSGTKSKIAYLIDTVKVTEEDRAKFGLTFGKKQNIMALFSILSVEVQDLSSFGVVDKDLDHWFGECINGAGMVWTKYASMENYFLDEDLVRGLVLVTGKCKIADWPIFYESFLDTLKVLYSMRLADEELALNIGWKDFYRYLSRDGDVVSINAERYQEVHLQHGLNDKSPAFTASRVQWMDKLIVDQRDMARGHDFLALLAWVLSRMGGIKALASEEVLARMWLFEAQINPNRLDLVI